MNNQYAMFEDDSNRPPLRRTCYRCGKTGIESLFSKTGWKGVIRNICKECRNKESKACEQRRRSSIESRASRLVSSAKTRAKRSGWLFDIDKEWVLAQLQTGVCQISGIPFDLSEKKGFYTPSLDQKIPQAGYTRNNTRVILFGMNAALGNWGADPLIKAVNSMQRIQSSPSTKLSRVLASRLMQDSEVLKSRSDKIIWREMITPGGHLIPMASVMEHVDERD